MPVGGGPPAVGSAKRSPRASSKRPVKVPQRNFPVRYPGTRMSGMTGPDDAFLTPDDALRDFDEDTVDLTPDEDDGPTESPADDEADPSGAAGTEAAPG